MADLPEAFVKSQGQLLKQPSGDREMAEILALVLHYFEQTILRDVELGLEAGVPTRTHILNLLHRQADLKTVQVTPIDAPQAPTLRQEPKANVARYDTLRGNEWSPCAMILPVPSWSSSCVVSRCIA